ncbi:MAG: hypothetical protein M0Z94_00095 [Dehalococcoidales bacterium]|nr:hypothetical protein [Dehalococcoidales bacterium]
MGRGFRSDFAFLTHLTAFFRGDTGPLGRPEGLVLPRRRPGSDRSAYLAPRALGCRDYFWSAVAAVPVVVAAIALLGTGGPFLIAGVLALGLSVFSFWTGMAIVRSDDTILLPGENKWFTVHKSWGYVYFFHALILALFAVASLFYSVSGGE